MSGKSKRLKEKDYFLDFILIEDPSICKESVMKILVTYLADHKSLNQRSPLN